MLSTLLSLSKAAQQFQQHQRQQCVVGINADVSAAVTASVTEVLLAAVAAEKADDDAC